MPQVEVIRPGRSRVFRLHENDGDFNREFWAGISPEARKAMVWDMVLEHRARRGEDGDEPRLQRSVCSVERRRR